MIIILTIVISTEINMVSDTQTNKYINEESMDIFLIKWAKKVINIECRP